MSEPRIGVEGSLIRLFYEIWEATLPGREYIVSSEIPDSVDRLARSNAADVNRALVQGGIYASGLDRDSNLEELFLELTAGAPSERGEGTFVGVTGNRP